MRILITNDDGIYARGIVKLAEMAKNLGEVWVVAPKGQCSAMSQKITLTDKIRVQEVSDFPVEDVKAYSVEGTPADCVKVAVEYLMKNKPNMVFSGINKGFNAGLEITYSGTIAAAMEALQKGIPAIAFSVDVNEIYDVVDAKILEITRKLLMDSAGEGKIWNVNFPGCKLEKCRGVLWDRTLARTQYHLDHFEAVTLSDGSELLDLQGQQIKSAERGSDLCALMEGYVSVGAVANMVLGNR